MIAVDFIPVKCAHWQADAKVSDKKLHKHLEHGDEHPLSAFSISEKLDVIDVYNWHQRIV